MTGKVIAVTEESNISTAKADDPDKAGGGFRPVSEQNQEVIYWNESEAEFWEKARRSAGEEPAVAYAYDDGTVRADIESTLPRTTTEDALLRLRAAADEREQGSAPGYKALLVEDVDRAIEHERERVKEAGDE